MECTVAFGPLSEADRDAVAALIHRSLVQWYESRLRQGHRFGDQAAPFRIFPDVYEALDPGETITARAAATGEILGVCFTHERPTHLAVGIVATAPESAGRGLAKRMLELALAQARRLGRPVRLVSSLLNLDSFSLYNRLGFLPGTLFQDLQLAVPAAGLPGPAPAGADSVREARPADAASLADLEFSLQGIRRDKDLAFFLQPTAGAWRVLMLPGTDGTPRGFLVTSTHPSALMIGPGVAADEAAATALLWATLDLLRGKSVVFLLPCAATDVVRAAYTWGARNVELHLAQSTAPVLSARGVVFPTFLPESG